MSTLINLFKPTSYIFFDEEQKCLSEKRLNFIQKFFRKAFGLYSSTHLNTVLSKIDLTKWNPLAESSHVSQKELFLKVTSKRGNYFSPIGACYNNGGSRYLVSARYVFQNQFPSVEFQIQYFCNTTYFFQIEKKETQIEAISSPENRQIETIINQICAQLLIQSPSEEISVVATIEKEEIPLNGRDPEKLKEEIIQFYPFRFPSSIKGLFRDIEAFGKCTIQYSTAVNQNSITLFKQRVLKKEKDRGSPLPFLNLNKIANFLATDFKLMSTST